MNVRVHFHGMRHSDDLQQECERQAEHLHGEFPEALKYEISLHHEANEFEAHVHVTGKEIDLASHAKSDELRKALAEVWERTKSQLRKHHDKLIFNRRRS